MNKKIIAVFCAVILMASVFSACGKKKLYTQNINGVEQPVVTDGEGNVVTNAEGEVAVYVTNAEGEKITAENGDPNINYVGAPNVLVNPNNTVNINEFTIKMPDGWEAADNGRISKSGTDMKCYIQALYVAQETDENTFKTYLDATLLQNRQMIDAINSGSEEAKKAGYSSAEYTSGDFKFQDYQCKKYTYIIYGDKGQVVHYAENIYFVLESGKIYSIDYVCENGVGYDKAFNFDDLVTNGISFKESVKK